MTSKLRMIAWIVILCAVATMAGCANTKPPEQAVEPTPPQLPTEADEPDIEAALDELEEELSSILETLDGLDMVDEEDLTP